MSAFDPAILRPQFPSLAAREDGRPVVFLDGPGGTQVPQRVIDAVAAYYRDANANHGGAFATSVRSDAILEEAHEAVADLLGAASPAEVKFGPSPCRAPSRASCAPATRS
jgi:selenocysteine lyase/cysteine desulfurase